MAGDVGACFRGSRRRSPAYPVIGRSSRSELVRQQIAVEVYHPLAAVVHSVISRKLCMTDTTDGVEACAAVGIGTGIERHAGEGLEMVDVLGMGAPSFGDGPVKAGAASPYAAYCVITVAGVASAAGSLKYAVDVLRPVPFVRMATGTAAGNGVSAVVVLEGGPAGGGCTVTLAAVSCILGVTSQVSCIIPSRRRIGSAVEGAAVAVVGGTGTGGIARRQGAADGVVTGGADVFRKVAPGVVGGAVGVEP